MKICRFCKKGKLKLLFKANKTKKNFEVSAFACTNSAFGLHGPIVICQNCQIVYVDELATQTEISTYYEIGEDPTYLAEQPARRLTFLRYLKRLEKFAPSKGKLLDVGTSTGLFVKLAKEAGWNATGLEPNVAAVKFAKRQYGLNLVNKPFTTKLFAKASFDAVTMWDVIEHFTDPISEMKKVSEILKPGGIFAFTTVDPDSRFAKALGTNWPWFMDMHRVFLTRPVARNYLTKIGFGEVTFLPHFRNLSLGYLSTRFEAISPLLARLLGQAIVKSGLSQVVVPYYANDLYDCFARKLP